MADKGGEIAVKAPNPFFSFFQNLVSNLPLPKFQAKRGDVDKFQTELGDADSGEGEGRAQKVDVVRFSDKRPIVPPPLKLEAEESDNNSSPTVLWQVYALGGVIILRWAWARWNERRKKDEASDEEPSVTED